MGKKSKFRLPGKKDLQRAFSMLHDSNSGDCTIMMLDTDEWFLLFQPLFENYLNSIKSGQRNDFDELVRPASDPLF
ncbi:MAG: hypothetical protein KFF68_02170 [Desulfosarcina sp.]|nr:hypothetical protein [Desulfosarcina sp.]